MFKKLNDVVAIGKVRTGWLIVVRIEPGHTENSRVWLKTTPMKSPLLSTCQ